MCEHDTEVETLKPGSCPSVEVLPPKVNDTALTEVKALRRIAHRLFVSDPNIGLYANLVGGDLKKLKESNPEVWAAKLELAEQILWDLEDAR